MLGFPCQVYMLGSRLRDVALHLGEWHSLDAEVLLYMSALLDTSGGCCAFRVCGCCTFRVCCVVVLT